ncbi:hypothetical protein COCCADRAFT_22977 [Bipolaris zeicola 26-R-13]|uniref:Uncharacterized protein n=1 Tax=Cochliobolus carbonum (strain 26-R-13) TaxID=930089 RepID=W6YD16_COCC2|nr:uncharacterized protein COCCADRAFT_22977 [Bipolaris zeicola 26-R-13]EUC37432.1 hypothetical protein COCCADRAFT_22977 [Bipolaris zeicola 26-R-13]
MAEDQASLKENTMQLAEILSDIVSLRVCDPAAALALVSARPDSSPSTTTQDTTAPAEPNTTPTTQQDESDPDLKRAKDLLKLHFEVKEAQKRGELSRGLEEARAMVERAVGG